MSIVWTILASILVFGAVIFIHELGHFVTAKISKIKVNEFSMGMGPKLFSFTKGETAYSLRLLPIGGFVAMEGEDEESDEPRAFNRAPVRKRILVIAAGAIMNLILGFSILLGLTASSDVILTRQIGQFDENAVTYETGLRDKDTILAINGRNLYTASDIFYEAMRLRQPETDVLVLRDGERILLENVRFDITETDTGYNDINIDFRFYAAKSTVWNIMKESAMQTVSLSRMIFLSLVDLVTGRVPINQMSGPVGIVTVISQAAKIDFSAVLEIMALISINLGIFNLIPLPALDGGRLAILVIEGITKKKMPSKYEAIIHTAGLIALFGLMIVVTFMDVTKLFKG